MRRHDGHPADPANVNGELRSKHHARGSPGYYAQNFRGQKVCSLITNPPRPRTSQSRPAPPTPFSAETAAWRRIRRCLFRAARLGERVAWS
jgi:hypothetical protein